MSGATGIAAAGVAGAVGDSLADGVELGPLGELVVVMVEAPRDGFEPGSDGGEIRDDLCADLP